MWAQLISVRVRPGKADGLTSVLDQLASIEQPGSGLVRQLLLQDQKDPARVHFLAVFESEDHARTREQDPRREEGLKVVREMMGELFEGPPEFTDLNVLSDSSG